MFLFLDRSEVTVNQVAELIGIGQSTASEQLTILKRAGLLFSRKEGKEVFYSTDRIKIMELLQKFNQLLTDCCK
ncbi:transcriptional regulator [Rhodococcus qingshengii]|nr:transcriptional regulator [Rhodococcus qingshengii]